MKTLFSALLLAALLPISSFACYNGDTSKTLLVVPEANGEENFSVGEILSADQSVRITRSGYSLRGTQGNLILVGTLYGNVLTFDRSQAHWASKCYPVILPRQR